MVIKDTRRLYARRQQVSATSESDRQPPVHDAAPADDPFEPRLDMQLKHWYQWLTTNGVDGNHTTVPDAVPTMLESNDKQ